MVTITATIFCLVSVSASDLRTSAPKADAPFHAIRVASAKVDGPFEQADATVVAQAKNPSAARLDSHRIALVFESTADPAGLVPVWGVTESKDEGRTWSKWRPLRVVDSGNKLIPIHQASLVPSPDGGVELLFTRIVAEDAKREDASPGTRIERARSRNGHKFRLIEGGAIKVDAEVAFAPLGVWYGDRLQVFAAIRAKEEGQPDSATWARWVTRDRHRLIRVAPPRGLDSGFEGSILSIDGELRAFFKAKQGIRSARSNNGRDWNTDPGMRSEMSGKPAVVSSGSRLLMFFESDEPHSGSNDAPMCEASEEAAAWLRNAASQSGTQGLADAINDSDDVSDDGDSLRPSKERDDESDDDSLGSNSAEASVDQQTTGAALVDNEPTSSIDDEYGFAPAPDFLNRIDYYTWFELHGVPQTDDNAYPYYAKLIPGPHDEPGAKPEWPLARGMYSDAEQLSPPGPWDPTANPEWAQSSEAYGDLISKYREAAQHEGYAQPVEPFQDNPHRDYKLLIEIALPSLSHHRSMSKVVLENAWRADHGEVDPKRMWQSLDTVLRSSNHVSQGGTLIENLVGIAMRNLVHSNAMLALKHEVFDEAGLEKTLDMLRDLDRESGDPVRLIRGEHAFAMDTTQYLFERANPDDPPMLRADRAREVGAWIADDQSFQQNLESMDVDDAEKSIEAFNSYYREIADQFRIGYPEVRKSDIEATTDRYIGHTPLTRTLLPSMSRVHQLATRNEASRRATQLAYATHLFKARNGRWPESFDELPAEYTAGVRTDPFSGEDFEYRVNENGPRIYSRSENGIDDDGIHSPRWDSEITNDAGSDDYVFYPPQESQTRK